MFGYDNGQCVHIGDGGDDELVKGSIYPLYIFSTLPETMIAPVNIPKWRLQKYTTPGKETQLSNEGNR